MKKSNKAVWLSLLLFPGAGQLYLKRTARGLLFMAPAIAAVVYLFNDALDQANRIAAQILSGAASMDPAALAAQIEAGGGNTFWANVAGGVVLLCWVGAVVDAWWLTHHRADQ